MQGKFQLSVLHLSVTSVPNSYVAGRSAEKVVDTIR